MKLLACGAINLDPSPIHSEDGNVSAEECRVLREVTGLGQDISSIKILFAGWSETDVLLNNRDLKGVRADNLAATVERFSSRAVIPISATGDHNGLTALLDANGTLHLPDSEPSRRIPAMLVDHIACTTTCTALIPRPHSSHDFEIHIFDSLTAASSFLDTSSSSPAAHVISGAPRALVANSVSFALLTAAGAVLTWGDARYPGVLGRDVEDDSAVPTSVPTLEGLRVVKIVGCGWWFAALTEAGDVYIWGGRDKSLLEKLGTEEQGVVRVDFEEMELVDVAVGCYHFLVLDEEGVVWGAGSDEEGQLGGAGGDGWKRLLLGNIEGTVVAVAAGDETSFVVVK